MDYVYDFGNKKNKNKKKIIVIIIFIVLVIIISAFLFKDSNNKVVSKISSVVVYPFNKMYDFGIGLTNGFNTYFADKKQLKSQNEDLKNEVNNLKMQLIESQRIVDENTSLKQMLEIKKSFQHFNVKMGKIIYREHDNWTQTFKINLGKNDGIEKNQAVVHTDGLVGYISNVEDDTATVVTILDPISSVSVNISTINEPAVLKGDLSLKSTNKLSLKIGRASCRERVF